MIIGSFNLCCRRIGRRMGRKLGFGISNESFFRRTCQQARHLVDRKVRVSIVACAAFGNRSAAFVAGTAFCETSKWSHLCSFMLCSHVRVCACVCVCVSTPGQRDLHRHLFRAFPLTFSTSRGWRHLYCFSINEAGNTW